MVSYRQYFPQHSCRYCSKILQLFLHYLYVISLFKRYVIACCHSFVKKGLMVAQNLMLVIMPCPLILLKCSFINFLLILMHLFLNFRYFCQFESEESLNTYFLRRFSYKFLFLKICSQKESYFLGQFWF